MATPIYKQPSMPVNAPRIAQKKSMFVLEDGKNVFFTFALLVLLFALWGFCNGMIDVMDKHFQEVLHLNLGQSAWVQFAHYLGYFLMALPAGWLATKLGYKAGIITGLLMVAVGGFWFIPATHIASFWAFLLGVCIIAAGLTFLETIANPYTTVLGPPEYGATRINLAQSCNGIGLLLGPVAGGYFFYAKNASGQSTGSAHIWIPYTAIAVLVLVLAVVFYFAEVPDIKTEEVDATDKSAPEVTTSIWKHPHFVLAVVAQFFYIAAQAGIFSFFINYMTSQVPAIPAAWAHGAAQSHNWLSVHSNGVLGISNQGAANLASVGFLCFLIGRFNGLAQKICRSKPPGALWRGQRSALPGDFPQTGLAFSVLCLPDLFLYVDHVSDDLCSGHLRAGCWREASLVLYRHGDHGRSDCAEDHGRGRGSLRSLPWLHCTADLLRSHRRLRIFLAQT